MNSFKKFGFSDKKLLGISNSIRTIVFVQEQKVSAELEYEFEEKSNFYLQYYNEIPIATARWRETSKGIKLERFAMLKKYRNRGLGSSLLKEVMTDVMPLNRKIYLHSQIDALNYYQRAGFVKRGKIFIEAGIKHYLMEYKGS